MNSVRTLFEELRERLESAEERIRLGALYDLVKYYECKTPEQILAICGGILQNSNSDIFKEATIIRAYCILKNKLYKTHSQALLHDLNFLKIGISFAVKEIARALLDPMEVSELRKLISTIENISNEGILNSSVIAVLNNKFDENIPLRDKCSLLISYLSCSFHELNVVDKILGVLMRKHRLSSCSEFDEELLALIQSKSSDTDLRNLRLINSIKGLKINLNIDWVFVSTTPKFEKNKILFSNLNDNDLKLIDKEMSWISNNDSNYLIRIIKVTSANTDRKISVQTEEFKLLLEELLQRRKLREYFTLSEFNMIYSQIMEIKQFLLSKSIKQKFNCKDFVIVKPCTIKLYRVDLHGPESDDDLLQHQLKYLENLNN